VRAGADVPSIDALDREDLALVVITPTHEMRTTTYTDIYRIAAAALRARTNLNLKTYDGIASIDECAGALGCMVLSVRSADPIRRTPKFLVVLSIKSSVDATDRLSAVLVDAAEALRSSESVPSDEYEDAVFSKAVRASPPTLTLKDEADVAPQLEHLFLESFRDAFLAAGSWQPSGAFDIESEGAGAEIRIDDRAIGFTFQGRTRVTGVRLGRRHVVVRDRGIELATDIDVDGGSIAVLDMKHSAHEVATDRRPVEAALLWGGIGTASLGVAIMSAGLVDAKITAHDRLCIEPTASACSSPGFLKTAGVLVVPLGYSLALGGAIVGAGSFFDGDEPFHPWLEIVAGLVAGATAYALSLHFDH
jgi:hypothetical protein